MSENKYVTKAKIGQGTKFTEDIETAEGIFKVRQLTYGEKGQASAFMTKGLLGKASLSGKTVDALEGAGSDMVKNMYDYNAYLVSCALSLDQEGAEQWSPEDVNNLVLKENTMDYLVKAIEISNGMGKGSGGANGIIKPFREDKNGDAISTPDSTRKDSISTEPTGSN